VIVIAPLDGSVGTIAPLPCKAVTNAAPVTAGQDAPPLWR
jgi:hypothetical protein